MGAEYVLQMKNITKRYGETTVLSDVSLSVRPGEIHALLGENGAGKSTLMNVLFGMPVIHTTGGFDGEVLIDGEKASILTPNDAMNAGIGMVHQEFMLLPGFTITENIKLNREITRPTVLSRALHLKNMENLDMPAMRKDARKALDSVGMGLDENTLVKGLPVGYMQFVEIAREIDKKGIRLLVFDEPTAVLTESEAETLISVMKQIAQSGIAIIFITHRLDEVMAAADNITILRDGKLAATRETKATSLVELAELMIGRKGEAVVATTPRAQDASANIALSIKNLIVDMPGEMVKGVDLEVREGEILGVGGLAGQGKIGIPNGIMGLYPAAGEVKLFGKDLPLNDAANALRSGMAMVSEDRRGVGLLLDQSIEDNIAFNAMQINGDFLRKVLFATTKDGKKVRAHANEMIRQLDIRCTSSRQAAGTLSGGNQQKVCVARALTMNPKFLFVSEPTRGIDIGAKKLVLETLVKLNREQGMTIVMVSSELQELRSISDRIAIVSEGKVVDILAPDASDADFGLAMSGIKPTKGGEGAHE
ncbi:MAG TPA: sugar ABC transporter ATP-binding protein [Candidatus Pullichristensenella avicola]|nr:sugar ABC transporter ATP-binding protein [Candidatus Pullichristensenella avicola]